MSQYVMFQPRFQTDRFKAAIPVFLIASVAIHLVTFSALTRLSGHCKETAANKPIELITVEVDVPKPAPLPEEKSKEVPKIRPKPPPIKVAASQPPVQTPKNRPPPPPNEAATPLDEPPQLVVGISMSSTTTAGAFAAPVGNTLYGKSPDKARKPADVKPYNAPNFAPIYQVDSEPQVIGEVKIPYPEDVRRAGIEGAVVMNIAIDANGEVVAAKVLHGPHPSLNQAALNAIRRFKFKPAIKNGEAVSTELKYTYSFLLD
jgi:protein TonB